MNFMNCLHYYMNFFKYSLTILIIYNLIVLALLFIPSNSIKLKLWNITPYDYSYIMDFPNYLNKKSDKYK